MSIQNSTKSLIATCSWKNIFVISTLLISMFPITVKASSLEKSNSQVNYKECIDVSHRPLSHFLDNQGTLNNPPLFFPGVKDYVGWTDNNPQTTFALVDYAGLANKYIKNQTGHSVGTKVNGFIIECALSDGRAQVTVNIITTKALGFAQSIDELVKNNFDFLNTPTIFGAKAQEVIAGKKSSIGSVLFSISFLIPQAGANLPDLLDVINPDSDNKYKYAPIKLNFKSTIFAKCANGKKARLEVHQIASTNELNALIFTKEKVEITDSKGSKCSE